MASILAALVLSGCNQEDSRDLQRDAGKLVKTAETSIKNASVAVKVSTVLSLRKGVDMSGFRVGSKEGTITLTGTVRTAEEKKLVLETAMGVRGVEKIVDELKVEPIK